MKRRQWSSERGLTLTEVTIVAVLASIVMLGLVGFYMSSQGTWMSASAKAITQREATTLLENISEKVHAAAGATVIGNQLELFDSVAPPHTMYVFWWEQPDSTVSDTADCLIHEGPDRDHDRGSAITSKCERFVCTAGSKMVQVDLLLRSAEGDTVHLNTKIAMINRPA
jgi:hypothetical protein